MYTVVQGCLVRMMCQTWQTFGQDNNVLNGDIGVSLIHLCG